ncbi:MAG TPA: hypothetical protein VKP30_26030 [Polyangiaceae bacterium]|nr:hypothetical protein [Polyangiaceae bacterium]
MSDEKTYDAKTPELIAKIQAAADAAIQGKFRDLRAEQEALEARFKEQQAFTDAVIRAI